MPAPLPTSNSSRRGAEPLWRQQGNLWCLEAAASGARGAACGLGLIEFIGGSYLAATPQISYRRLLEALARHGWRIHAWSYVPGFDHQSQANQAWRDFRQARQDHAVLWAESPSTASAPLAAERSAGDRRSGAGAPGSGSGRDQPLPVLRLGHSLGCKLHLLAPDGGRGSAGLVALAFNNYSAERSVPLLAEAGQRFGFRSEFSPSPAETLRQVASLYGQPRNLVVRFQQDGLDQSRRLLACLQQRPHDASVLLELRGDHLTPASAGLRRQLLGDWADDPSRQRGIEELCAQIERWWST